MSYKNISCSEIFQLFLFVEVIFKKALSNDIIVKYFIDIATEVEKSISNLSLGHFSRNRQSIKLLQYKSALKLYLRMHTQHTSTKIQENGKNSTTFQCPYHTRTEGHLLPINSILCCLKEFYPLLNGRCSYAV